MQDEFNALLRTSTSGIIVLLLYVDDILITGSDVAGIRSLINSLSRCFEMKVTEVLHYILGMEVSRSPDRLVLTQTKYTLDLLQRANMLTAKPISTPVSSGSKLSAFQGDYFADVSLYRSLVGALQYLTITRPDITYAVNQVCQFMYAPTTAHMVAGKRILRYLKGTLGFDLTFAARASPPTSHFFFADDLVLFAEASVGQMEVVMACLNEFCSLSGQSISLTKSKLFVSPNCSRQLARNISALCGIPLTSDLGKYFGVPLLHQRVTKATYYHILEKVQARLAGWKTDQLSLAGRTLLIQSVTSSIPLYTMQTTSRIYPFGSRQVS